MIWICKKKTAKLMWRHRYRHVFSVPWRPSQLRHWRACTTAGVEASGSQATILPLDDLYYKWSSDDLSSMKLLIFVYNHDHLAFDSGTSEKKNSVHRSGWKPAQKKKQKNKTKHRSHKCNQDQPSVMEEFLFLSPAGVVAACGWVAVARNLHPTNR